MALLERLTANASRILKGHPNPRQAYPNKMERGNQIHAALTGLIHNTQQRMSANVPLSPRSKARKNLNSAREKLRNYEAKRFNIKAVMNREHLTETQVLSTWLPRQIRELKLRIKLLERAK